ncbi:hypothetical protein LEP1GSC196_3257 [Leptospira meyeri serovar Semaranga str. Veldrot Semarang 173]|nr:hypothetical protein LEP1GSC196_3257 [Leptospira meyeri serovar Semaranga str. Veldrot Semarang 173]
MRRYQRTSLYSPTRDMASYGIDQIINQLIILERVMILDTT